MAASSSLPDIVAGRYYIFLAEYPDDANKPSLEKPKAVKTQNSVANTPYLGIPKSWPHKIKPRLGIVNNYDPINNEAVVFFVNIKSSSRS